MWANCSRCSARASAFAPASSSTDGPSRAGSETAIAGRSTPGRRRRWSSPAASTAPVFPAETIASASPSATARTAETRVESGFDRTASVGLSAISITSSAGRERQAARVEPGRADDEHVDPVGSRLRRRRPRPRQGPLSPPSASTAIRGKTYLRSLDAEGLDLAPLVRTAGRADVVRPLRRAALRARVDARSFDLVLRPPLVAPCLRGFPFRDSHERATL